MFCRRRGGVWKKKWLSLLLTLFFVQTSWRGLRQEEDALGLREDNMLRLREETFVTLCFVVRKKTFAFGPRSKNVASGKSIVSG